ncbi:MAG: C25 family cysteine peptidase, partial [Bacteroidota bacterium]
AMSSSAQPFGNEWINYSQQYFKVKVSQNGIYRISRQTLLFAGVNVSGLDPRKYQLYCNGQQQFIHIEGEGDGVFDQNDFIEFYGKKNDGSLDTKLYANPDWQPNPYYSNFTDTAIYYLTWSPLGNGLRMDTTVDSAFSNYAVAPYCIKETFFQDPAEYNYGYNNNSMDYTESEGWCRVFGYKAEQPNQGPFPYTIQFPVRNVFTGGPVAEIEYSVGGINNLAHYLSVTFPGYTFTDTYYIQEHKTYRFSASASSLTLPTSNLILASSSNSGGSNDYQGFYYAKLRFPHTFDFENTNKFEFEVPDAIGQAKARLAITSFASGPNAPILYDLTNHRRIVMVSSGSSWQGLLTNDGNTAPKKCLIVDPAAIPFTASISAINYSTTNFGYFNNLTGTPIDSAYLIVSNRSLWSQATAYLNYRNTTTGGKSILVDTEELTDQFAYGVKNHPYAVRNFCDRILRTWTNAAPPQHLLLIGKSLNPLIAKREPWNYGLNLVPSFGVPSSDILFTAGLDGSLFEPRIPTGRISARNGTEVLDYLQKVQEYESTQSGPPLPWMKEILHFGGGNDPAQQSQLSAYLDDYKGIMEDENFGGKVTTYLKFTSVPIVINQSDSLQAQIDSGVAVMTFFGHASGSGFDQSTDEPSEYNNRGRYPLVVANSCFAGDIHTSQKSVSEKFVLEPSKAAIGFIASVGLGVPNDLFLYSHAFFENASKLNYGASIGQLMRMAVQEIQIPNIDNIKNVCQEMSLHGDPSLKLNNFNKPDFTIDESSIRFTPEDITTELDTFSVRVDVRNIARGVKDTFTVKLTRIFPDGSDSVYFSTVGDCFYNKTSVFNLRTGGFGASGINRFIVDVDPYNSVSELDDYTNNKAMTSL